MSTQVRTLAMVVNVFNIYLYTYIWYCIVLDDLIVQYSKEFCIEWHCARAAARASSERFFFPHVALGASEHLKEPVRKRPNRRSATSRHLMVWVYSQLLSGLLEGFM